ncbi:dolichyl-diphosphooligosaccharide--protein glycosyltransferase [Haloprofundus marisrubri]|uniref:dolichyl-phosphooligosaccharide-protein glycotransferase n=1 Tax=Haloprofundus marisrubri TaxID=1514971 RepID=A0A0W1RBG3_9EURY|nr:oligosaccharyl transferase, archaeosortase A system-associated [Haloprofundus marisrubri]KTG10453.1 dolichyl-diphosphooligosaccharide--protein glycosyltransferase [Haloprofundus marisrubri]
MSHRTESVEETEDSYLDRLEDWYHIPALLGVVAVMLYYRLQGYGNYIQNGTVVFSGNDAWYHLREVEYTVRHWPFTMPFDPWTYFPYGTYQGQFGTLYDQIVATAALIIGLGSPSDQLVAQTLLVAPAVFGALTAIPVYLIGKRLGGRLAGLFGAVILMQLPGSFLRRSLVGVSDHNGVEPLFMAIAILAFIVAFAVAEREKPIWELVADRDRDALRSPLKWSALAGVALALYMWVWPPGVLLVGVVGTFIVVKMVSDVVNGESPEPIAFVGAVSMGVTALFMLLRVDTFEFSATQFSLIQPVLAFAVGAGSVFLAWLARQWESRDLSTALYPAAVGGAIVVSLGLMAVVLPDAFQQLTNNFQRILGFSAGARTRTISEAQPFLDPNTLSQFGTTATLQLLSEYGLAIFTGVAAATWMLAKPLIRGGDSRNVGYVAASVAVVGLLYLIPAVPKAIGGALGIDHALLGLIVVFSLIVGATLLTSYRSEHLLVVVWAAFMTAAAFTQLRFNYYLALVVVVMNAFLLGEILGYLGLRKSVTRVTDDVEVYQILAVVTVVMLVLTPVLLVPLGGSQGQQTATAQQIGAANSPGAYTQWQGSLGWMANNTPQEGNYGGAGNADQLGYYERFDRPADSDYDYPEGAYGVMSWWDYGHWITMGSERIPNANPFQQGATSAANFLLAPSEQQSQEVLESQSTEGNQTRYVMVDWEMVTPGEKFGAPVVFYDENENLSQADFYQRIYAEGFQGSFFLKDQRYYDSTMVRLYEYHGSAMDPQPFVVDWEPTPAVNQQTGEEVSVPTPVGEGENATLLRTFDNMSAAREFVEEDGTAQVGGVGPYPEERVEAMEHYRLVKASESSATQSRSYFRQLLSTGQITGLNAQFLTQTPPQWVKTFERVPGATVEGSGAPANSEVRAAVQMEMAGNQTFTYVQYAETDANGNFEFTLPYSTTGYDETGDGYTNVSVRSNGPYYVSTQPVENESGDSVQYTGTVNVSDAKVVGEDDSPATVELTETPAAVNTGSDNETAGNETAENESVGNGTGENPFGNESVDNESANSSNDSTAGNDSNSTSLVAPDASAARSVTAALVTAPVTVWS